MRHVSDSSCRVRVAMGMSRSIEEWLMMTCVSLKDSVSFRCEMSAIVEQARAMVNQCGHEAPRGNDLQCVEFP